MAKVLKAILTTLAFIGVPVMFLVGLNSQIFSTDFVESTQLSPDEKQGMTQVLTGFIFAIGYCSALLILGVVTETILRIVKPKKSKKNGNRSILH